MKIKQILLVIALCCFTTINAQDNLKVILKNGSELVGFISSQRPGDHITFACKYGQFYLDSKDLKSIESNQININELPKEWLQWANKHKALIDEGNDKFLKLDRIYTKDSVIEKVRILEDGVKIKYLSFTEHNYPLSWDTIKVLKSEIRPKLQLSGINRRYKLRSGLEYEGQYVEEVPGKTVSLYQENGVIQIFNRKDVLKDIRYKINSNQSLYSQSDLIDIVQLKNGETYEGIIIERNYTPTDSISNDYLLIQSRDGRTQNIKLSYIQEYRKTKNPLYKPLTDVILNEGVFMVNRKLAHSEPVKQINHFFIIQPDSVKLLIPISDLNANLAIETKLKNVNLSSQIKLVKVNRYVDKKKKLFKDDYKVSYGFNYENLLNDPIIPNKIETSINGTTKFEYKISNEDIYAIYDLNSKKIMLFKTIRKQSLK